MKKIIVTALLTVAAAGGAHAHTALSGSMPADKAELQAAPAELMLHFSAPVRLTALTIQQRGAAKQDLKPLPSGASKDFAVQAPALGDGQYVVSWRALAEDGHVMSGEFTFTLKAIAADGHHSTH